LLDHGIEVILVEIGALFLGELVALLLVFRIRRGRQVDVLLLCDGLQFLVGLLMIVVQPLGILAHGILRRLVARQLGELDFGHVVLRRLGRELLVGGLGRLGVG